MESERGVDDGYKDQAAEKLRGHKPSGLLRGGNYSAFEAGTLVPFMVRWPESSTTGVSDALVSKIDFMAFLAALTGQELGYDDTPDSFNVLPVLLGDSETGRL